MTETQVEQAIDNLARAMSPDAWAEYDAGNGVCTNSAGWECIDTIKKAQKLLRAFPRLVELVTDGQ